MLETFKRRSRIPASDVPEDPGCCFDRSRIERYITVETIRAHSSEKSRSSSAQTEFRDRDDDSDVADEDDDEDIEFY